LSTKKYYKLDWDPITLHNILSLKARSFAIYPLHNGLLIYNNRNNIVYY